MGRKRECWKTELPWDENVSLLPLRCNRPIQVKLKGRKRTFREKDISGFISKKKKEGFSTISLLFLKILAGKGVTENPQILPCAMRALVRLVPAVNLPVSVQTARVRKLLSTHLAGNCRLPVRSDLTGSGGDCGQWAS